MPRVLLRLRNSDLASLGIWQQPNTENTDQIGSIIDKYNDESWRLLEIDIGELRPIEKRVVSLAVLDALWKKREACLRKPTLVVIDEAHHLVPKDPQLILSEATTDIINEIAGEGRKYGIFLIVVSQSPSKIHPYTLSQCGNLILMKMKYESDLAVLRDAYSQVPRSMIDQAKNFGIGEAFVVGDKLVKSPTRFRFSIRRSSEGQPKVNLRGARAVAQ